VRRKTAAHLDDQAWLKVADHTVSHQCINAMKRPLLPRRRLYWKLVIFAAEFRKMILQEIELHRVVHVDAHEFTRPIP
jgi:hypothetical protein